MPCNQSPPLPPREEKNIYIANWITSNYTKRLYDKYNRKIILNLHYEIALYIICAGLIKIKTKYKTKIASCFWSRYVNIRYLKKLKVRSESTYLYCLFSKLMTFLIISMIHITKR